jgi:hypothetical protein
MKFPKAQVLFSLLVGCGVYWVLGRTMDSDGSSAHAAVQRQWLVVFLLTAGAYVIFKYRHAAGGEQPAGKPAGDIAKRARNLGAVGWVFAVVGVVMALRLIWR